MLYKQAFVAVYVRTDEHAAPLRRHCNFRTLHRCCEWFVCDDSQVSYPAGLLAELMFPFSRCQYQVFVVVWVSPVATHDVCAQICRVKRNIQRHSYINILWHTLQLPTCGRASSPSLVYTENTMCVTFVTIVERHAITSVLSCRSDACAAVSYSSVMQPTGEEEAHAAHVLCCWWYWQTACRQTLDTVHLEVGCSVIQIDYDDFIEWMPEVVAGL